MVGGTLLGLYSKEKERKESQPGHVDISSEEFSVRRIREMMCELEGNERDKK